MKPMLDPARDLAGATPEKLAKALFRRTEPLRPGTRESPLSAMRSRYRVSGWKCQPFFVIPKPKRTALDGDPVGRPGRGELALPVREVWRQVCQRGGSRSTTTKGRRSMGLRKSPSDLEKLPHRKDQGRESTAFDVGRTEMAETG